MHAEPYALPQQVASKIEVEPGGCWRWTAAICHYGYGAIRYERRTRRAHRLVYELLVGPIPDGHELHHRCERRDCVNPEHLEPLTSAAHRALLAGGTRPRARRRPAACPHGHAYDEANTSVRADGSYFCRTCHRDRARVQRAAA